jgi:hypothetical protein
MTEKTERESKFKNHIPEEAREHYKSAREEMRKGVEALMPEGVREFREHRRKAGREMLLAWRSMLDAALERMDKKD